VSFGFAASFEEISCLELLSSCFYDSCLTCHSAVMMVTAVTHTSESCRNLFAQDN